MNDKWSISASSAYYEVEADSALEAVTRFMAERPDDFVHAVEIIVPETQDIVYICKCCGADRRTFHKMSCTYIK